jgi:L-ascorbate metabolism protein UlaG (beta-lactamase superfamily)
MNGGRFQSISAALVSLVLVCTTLIHGEEDVNQPDSLMSNFKDGKYRNIPEVDILPGSQWGMLKKWMFGNQVREPERELPVVPLKPGSIFSGSDSALQVVWMGHSSLILEIDGARLMLDPVFSSNPSPAPFLFSLKRFQGKPPIAPEDLPELDAVVISHDHYDHLDKKTIKGIHHKVGKFLVPPGVDAYVRKWGVPDSKIETLDWGDSVQLGRISLVVTPARHFSGRGMTSQNKTLWTSWVIRGPVHKVYFSGDSGYFPGFRQIGDNYGPFDLTFLDCAQYSPYWEPCHMFPEKAVQANLELRGRVLMPIHWGTFKLSYHDWYEPAERLVSAAEKAKVNFVIPIPGEVVHPGSYENKYWWRDYK